MQTTRLNELADDLLEQARAAASGRAAHALLTGHEHRLKQVVLALAAGHRLAEHDNPGEATVQVLKGRVTLQAGPQKWSGAAGDHLVIPAAQHDLSAEEDAVVLLTIVTADHGRAARLREE